MCPAQESPLAQNRRVLTARFAELLFAREPASVLDLACGDGWLLAEAAARGVPSAGLDRSLEALDDTRDGGPPLVVGDGERLPFGDGTFAWVAFRNAAHHLEHPERVLREAWRVAREGLLVAEPHYDPAEEPQALGLAFDRWMKRQHRRRGMVHEENLSAEQLLAPLGDEPAHVAVELVQPRVRYRPEDVDELAARACAGDIPADERAELTHLRAAATEGLLTLGGSVILTLQKRSARPVPGTPPTARNRPR